MKKHEQFGSLHNRYVYFFLITGGCENRIIYEDLESLKYVKKTVVPHSNKAALCDDTNSLLYNEGNIFNLRNGKIIYRKRQPFRLDFYDQSFNIYHNSLYSYNSSSFYFFMKMLSETPNQPYISILFTQDQKYSWIDIIIKIKYIEKSQSSMLVLCAGILVKQNFSSKITVVGSAYDKLVIVKLNSIYRSSKIIGVQVNISTRFQTQLYDAAGSSLYYPRVLHWNSKFYLSISNFEYRINLPGQPINLTVGHSGKGNVALDILWVHDSNNIHRSFLNQCPGFCKLQIYCSNTSLWKKGWRGKLQKDAIPNQCLPKTNAYNDILGISNFPNVCPTKHVNQIPKPLEGWYKSFKPAFNNVRCLVYTYCYNFSTSKNYFKKKWHYFVNFYFHKEDMTSVSLDFQESHGTRKSWIEASLLCRSAGGSLPILRSKEELDELITVLKVEHKFAAVQFLFIGLVFSKMVNSSYPSYFLQWGYFDMLSYLTNNIFILVSQNNYEHAVAT